MPIPSKIIILLSCLFLVLGIDLKAQLLQKDTLNVAKRYEVVGYTTNLQSKKIERLDTSLNNFHHFDPSLTWPYQYRSLGNIGLPNHVMRFDYDRGYEFDSGFRNYENLFFHPHSVPYFQVRAPLTDLYYGLGARESQVLQASHAQTVRKYHQLGLHYRRLVSQGRYQRQKSGVHALSLSDWYLSKNKRYQLLASLVWNRATPQLNGGMADPDLFANYSNPLERAGQEVLLSAAEAKYNELNYFIRQEYALGYQKEPEKTDTLAWQEWKATEQGNGLSLLHEFHMKRSHYEYKDDPFADDGFYTKNGYRTSVGRTWTDKWYMRSVKNSIGLSYRPKQDNFLKGSYGEALLVHEYNSFRDTVPKADTIGLLYKIKNHNLGLSASLRKEASKLQYVIHAKLGLLGNRAGNFQIDSKAQLLFAASLPVLYGKFKLSNLSPAFLQNFTFMDNFFWQNDFKNEQHALWTAGAMWSSKNLKLDLNLSNHLLTNYITYDREALPIQLADAVTIQQISASMSISLGKFHFRPHALWQTTGSDQISLPELYLAGNAWYENNVFGDAMVMQVGVELSYWSSHRAYGFMPATNIFYLTADQEVDAYPLLSVFTSARIKQARLFLSATNALMGIPENGYYTVANYPMQDRGINFGVSWRFYD